MNIVFVMRTPFFLKNFTAGLQQLLARGHSVHVVFSEPMTGRVGEHLAGASAEMLPGVTMEALPPPAGRRSTLAKLLATVMDVLRYDAGAYDDAPKLRKRANGKPGQQRRVALMLWLARRAGSLVGPARVERFLRALLDAVPPSPQLVQWLRERRTDLFLVSPLTPIGSEQAAWVLAARAAGARVVYCMYSWDNLTNKGLLRPHPDGAVVWNQTHLEEAVQMHGMDPQAVHCTGAQGFDVWFASSPSTTREEFCSRVGLDAGRPYVLYTCSSVFVGGREEFPFVQRWLEALRQHPDPAVAGLGVLIRPHPQFADAWEKADFSAMGNVVVYPRSGAIPFAGGAKAEYYDSIHHSMAVVGINTSAMVEAAIIDRPVLTIGDPSYADTQEGTLHFRHLQRYGFLMHSPSIEENLGLLLRLLAGDGQLVEASHQGNRRFVADYIRPRGITSPAGPFWADAVETEAGRTDHRERPRPGAAHALLARAALPFAAFGRTGKRRSRKKAAAGAKPGKASRHKLLKRVKTPLDRLRRPEPTSVKELARLEGPYAILTKLDRAYASSAGGAPSVLVLGDSVYYRVSRDDEDRRALADMLTEELSGRGTQALCLNYSAYHPGVYNAILQALARMPRRPEKVVLPLNLRCYSPQWHLHPDHAYAEEITILRNYQPGQAIPEVKRGKCPSAEERFDEIPVSYPESPLTTVGQFRLVVKSSPQTAAQERWRARQIAIFHYLHPLAPDHPRLMDTVEMVRSAAAAGLKPLVYLTPINHQHGVRHAGDSFSEGVTANARRIEAAVRAEVERAGGAFHDWSLAFGDDLFFHPAERTEHLNEQGRRELATRIADALGRIK